MEGEECPKCHGKGQVKEADGTIHTCFDCLQSGKLFSHEKNIKDYGIKI